MALDADFVVQGVEDVLAHVLRQLVLSRIWLRVMRHLQQRESRSVNRWGKKKPRPRRTGEKRNQQFIFAATSASRKSVSGIFEDLDAPAKIPSSLDCRLPPERLSSHLMSDVTRILSAIEQGDPRAAERLLPLVYDELRKLAAQKLAQEKPGQTLQATALVHEAYLRLVDADKEVRWDSRGHFFAAAAEAMRRILIDSARHKQSQKCAGDRERIDLDQIDVPAPREAERILVLDEALTKLAQTDAQAAELVKLRYFVGFTVPEAAAALGISPRSADFLWAYARTWLQKELVE
jgi:RNA polymerase sigma factor (TIGR02999 family)